MNKSIEELKKLILRETDEAFRSHSFQQSSTPGRNYLFEITSADKKLFYFGSHHTNDPKDSMFAEIRNHFDVMQPDIVFVEGMVDINERKEYFIEKYSQESLEEKMLYGENLYTLKLAIDAHVEFESPEPTQAIHIQHLLQRGFSDADIFTERFYRIIAQYIRHHTKDKTKEGCIEYLRPYLEKFRKSSGWEHQDIDKMIEKLIAELDLDSSIYRDQANPNPRPEVSWTIINEIARTSSRFRDEYQLERIAVNLQNHDRLFIVYGSAHAVRLEPSLKALLQ